MVFTLKHLFPLIINVVTSFSIDKKYYWGKNRSIWIYFFFFFFLIVCSFCSDICFIQIAVLGGRNLLVYSNKKYNKYIYIYIYIFHSSENIWLGPQETFGVRFWFSWEMKTFFNPPAQNKWKYIFKSIANW